MILTALTDLQAVNEILGAMGEAPIDTLENIDNVDAQNALRMLHTVSQQIQTKGWTFNTVENYLMEVDKYRKVIPWNNNILIAKTYDGRIIRKREDITYDVTNNTTVFENSLSIKATLLVQFEDMPEVFRHYVTIRTARLFVSRYLGEQVIMQELQNEEQEAYRAVLEYEFDIEDNSMVKNPSVTALMQRG